MHLSCETIRTFYTKLFHHQPASVIYSEGSRFQIRVRVEKRTPGTMGEEGIATNVLHITFDADDEVPKIYPKSYGESLLYLTGKRHYEIQAANYRSVIE